MLSVSITTAEREILQENDIISLTVPTAEGVVTILPNHTPITSLVSVGEVVVKAKNGTVNVLFVDGGLLQVADNKVELLTKMAENALDIDTAKIEEAKRRAQKLLSEKPIDVDLVHVEASLRKALMREKIIKKYKPS